MNACRYDMIRTMAVVIPAQNEERRLRRCLNSVQRAAADLIAQTDMLIEIRTVVVLDRCTDSSVHIATSYPTVQVLQTDHARVGAARADGIRHAMSGRRPDTMWICCTDADSAVPADWLVNQLQHARRGSQLVLGTVRPDPAELSPAALDRWLDLHDLTDGHPHIHGANLGIRGDTYLAVGGFDAIAAHEDVRLVQRAQALGARVVSVGDSPVLTSARTHGRAPNGMACYLRQLGRLVR